MSVMLRLMNVPSDDLFAELFAKQLGLRFGGGGTITSGAHVIAETIASRYGLDPTILDGSGLGRQDRTSPKQIVQLLTRAVAHAGSAISWRRRCRPSASTARCKGSGPSRPRLGHCIAKTGTLDDVTNLAGYCTARSGQQLAFAFFIDGPREHDRLLAGEQDDRGDRPVLMRNRLKTPSYLRNRSLRSTIAPCSWHTP